VEDICIYINIFQNILKEAYKTGESRLRLSATTINYAMFVCLFGCSAHRELERLCTGVGLDIGT
jgi:hypothetical protein